MSASNSEMGFDSESDDRFIVRFEAWEGPIEALLDLARAKKVDLSRIDLLELVDQFEAVVRRASDLKLEVAADWLVAATWLAFLKSRMLLERPKEGKAAPGEDVLAFRLKRLAVVKDIAAALEARVVTGRDWFAPGASGPDADAGRLDIGLADLLAAFPRPRPQSDEPTAPDLKPFDLGSVDAAISRLESGIPDEVWVPILEMVPRGCGGLRLRSEIASVLVAALELAKRGDANVRQDSPEEHIMVRRRPAANG